MGSMCSKGCLATGWDAGHAPFFVFFKLAKPKVPGPEGQLHVSTYFSRFWACIRDLAHGWSPMFSLLTSYWIASIERQSWLGAI